MLRLGAAKGEHLQPFPGPGRRKSFLYGPDKAAPAVRLHGDQPQFGAGSLLRQQIPQKQQGQNAPVIPHFLMSHGLLPRQTGQSAKLLFAGQHIGDSITHLPARRFQKTGEILQPFPGLLIAVALKTRLFLVADMHPLVHFGQQAQIGRLTIHPALFVVLQIAFQSVFHWSSSSPAQRRSAAKKEQTAPSAPVPSL